MSVGEVVIGVVFGGSGLTGLALGVLSYFRRKPGERDDMLLALIKVLDGKIDKSDRKIESLTYRQRVWEDYVNDLRQHIADGKPPPPPDYPLPLLRIDINADREKVVSD